MMCECAAFYSEVDAEIKIICSTKLLCSAPCRSSLASEAARDVIKIGLSYFPLWCVSPFLRCHSDVLFSSSPPHVSLPQDQNQLSSQPPSGRWLIRPGLICSYLHQSCIVAGLFFFFFFFFPFLKTLCLDLAQNKNVTDFDFMPVF